MSEASLTALSAMSASIFSYALNLSVLTAHQFSAVTPFSPSAARALGSVLGSVATAETIVVGLDGGGT